MIVFTEVDDFVVCGAYKANWREGDICTKTPIDRQCCIEFSRYGSTMEALGGNEL